jgi:GH35 family endo-1,4-beta-xylanase
MPKLILWLTLFALVLTSCAPDQVVTPTRLPAMAVPSITPLPAAAASTPAPIATTPTFTPTATRTVTPTATPTITSTETPTPIPTLPPDLVGGLQGVPDPHYSNPELFDLTKPEAPIPQFVNAMKMGRIEVDAEEIAEGVAYQRLLSIDGAVYVIATYTVADDATQYTMILIATQTENRDWSWQNGTIRAAADQCELLIGSELHPDETLARRVKQKELNSGTMTHVWSTREKNEGVFTNSYDQRQAEEAQSGDFRRIRLSHILANSCHPEWLLSKTLSETKIVLQEHIKMVMKDYSVLGVTDFNIVNEPWHADQLAKKFDGRDAYVLFAFQSANKAREEIVNEAKQEGKPVPTIRLGLSHAENHYPGTGSEQTLELLSLLIENHVGIDYVDVHFHVKKTEGRPSVEDVRSTLAKYQRYNNPITGKPLEVVIGELDVNIQDMQGDSERYLKQAAIYQEYLTTVLDLGIKDVSFWGIVDSESWYERGEAGEVEPDADALLFDDSGRPKPSYYALLDVLAQAIQLQQPSGTVAPGSP